MPLSYTSVDTILQTLPMVGSVSNISSAAIYAAADRAESIINAKLSNLYTVPVSGSPPILTTVATDFAIYRLLSRRFVTQDKPNKSALPDAYKEAMDLLDQLAAGEISLLDSSGSAISANAAAGVPWSNTMTYEPTMNELDPAQQQIDPGKVDDLLSSQ